MFFIVSIICFCFVLREKNNWAYPTTTILDWKPADYDSRSADPYLRRPYEKTLPASFAGNADVRISFKAWLHNAAGYQNLFQTAGINEGLRMELSGERNLGLVYGKTSNTFAGMPLLDRMEPRTPYSFDIAYSARNKSLTVSVNGKTTGVTDPALAPVFSDFVVGRGFDSSRVFDGIIWDFHSTVSITSHSSAGTILGTVALIVSGLAALFFGILAILRLDDSSAASWFLGVAGVVALGCLLWGLKLAAPGFYRYYGMVPKLSLSNMGGFDVVSGVAGTAGNALYAFDGETKGEVFHSAIDVTTGTLQIVFPSPVRVARIGISPQEKEPNRTPRDFTVEGSGDGKSWTVLSSVSGANFSGTEAGDYKYFQVEDKSGWKYYRLNVARNNGGKYLTFSELKLEGLKDSRWLLALIAFYGFTILACAVSCRKLLRQNIADCTPGLFPVSLLFSATTIFFIPFRAYLVSAAEFGLGPAAVAAWLLLLTAAATGALYFMLGRLRPRARVFAVALLVCAAVLVWVEAAVIGWRGGPLDGSPVDWTLFMPERLHDAALWACFFVLGISFPGKICRLSGKISAAALAVQLIALPALWGAHRAEFVGNNSGSGQRNLMSFSRQGNVVILVLDMYQSNVFGELVNSREPLLDKLDGFTYFRNALSNYPVTSASIPAVLTGDVYDNGMPHSEYLRKVFRERSLFRSAFESGYSVSALQWIYNELYFPPEFGAGQGTHRDLAGSLLEMSRLADVALFLELPYRLKPRIYSDGQWQIYRRAQGLRTAKAAPGFPLPATTKRGDVAFVNRFASGADASSARPAFRFYHLAGNHIPLDTNEDLKAETMEFNLGNSVRQGKGAVRLAGEILDTMRRLGVYDNSLIIILGDHGSGVDIPPARGGKPLTGWLARGVPLLLVKAPGAAGVLKVSDAPVMLSDIPATVTALSRMKGSFPGMNVFSVEPDKPRARGFINSGTGSFLNDRFESLDYYEVGRNSWDASCWKFVRKVETQPSGR